MSKSLVEKQTKKIGVYGIKGGIGKTALSIYIAFAIDAMKDGISLALITQDFNQSFKYIFENGNEENLRLNNEDFFYKYIEYKDFEDKTQEQIEADLAENLIETDNGILYLEEDGEKYPLDFAIMDNQANHKVGFGDDDFSFIIHEARNLVSLPTSLEILEVKIKRELKEMEKHNLTPADLEELGMSRTKYVFVHNNITGAGIKTERDNIQVKLDELKEQYDVEIFYLEFPKFNFYFYQEHGINFMSGIDQINEVKEELFNKGITTSRNFRIRTGDELLADTTKQLSKILFS
ncbi:hypothetical protein KW496_19730 [Vibrio fluvialis]|nr:hypothetical protein [Vibrio fluvialis]